MSSDIGGSGGRLKAQGVALVTLLLAFAFVASVQPVSAYAPKGGDFFNYSQTITVNNGQGSYTGYTDQSQITGSEQMNSASGGIVSASYHTSYQYSSNQGASSSNSSSGDYTWSSDSFAYLNGTDNQVGYSAPTYVWFAMNASLPVGGTFYILNTQFTVLSANTSFQLPAGGSQYVQTIEASGTGQYQRNDDYGTFTASYTWKAYFDPTTGYIVGYNYVEQDSGQYQGAAGSFTYTDTLYVTSTSYPLVSASAPNTSGGTGLAALIPFVGYLLVIVVVLLVVAISIYAIARRRTRRDTIPQHSYAPPAPSAPSSAPWESKIDLGSKPPEQVVIREVQMWKCRYCGTLFPASADRCPYCGGPKQ
jgi:hypothetical protein